MKRAIVTLTGRVQHVGFRWWAASQARQLGLAGHATNLDDGDVEVSVQGEDERVYTMVRLLVEQPTTSARPGMVTGHSIAWRTPTPGLHAFTAY